MSRSENLLRLQCNFFQALSVAGEPSEVRGRFGIYRYAYFERIRASIEEDFPMLFEYLNTLSEFPGGLTAEQVTRDLLERNHPASWTLAEASLPVMASIEALLAGSRWANELGEARRLAALDEAEGLSAWLEEWPEPKSPRSKWISEFAAGELLLARTKTWCPAGDKVFWRSEKGSRSETFTTFSEFFDLFPLVELPVKFSAFSHAAENFEPAKVSIFFQRGIAEGWLRFTAIQF